MEESELIEGHYYRAKSSLYFPGIGWDVNFAEGDLVEFVRCAGDWSVIRLIQADAEYAVSMTEFSSYFELIHPLEALAQQAED